MLPIVLTAALAPERPGRDVAAVGRARSGREGGSVGPLRPGGLRMAGTSAAVARRRARPTIDPRDGPVVGGVLRSKSHGVVLDLWPSMASNHEHVDFGSK